MEVATVNQRVLLATASELSVRLWTIQGQFLCIFGQPDSWTHLGLLETAPLVVKQEQLEKRKSLQLKLREAPSAGGSLVVGSAGTMHGDTPAGVDNSAAKVSEAAVKGSANVPPEKGREQRFSISSIASRRFGFTESVTARWSR